LARRRGLSVSTIGRRGRAKVNCLEEGEADSLGSEEGLIRREMRLFQGKKKRREHSSVI